MTGTDVARFTHKQSRSYLNHLVHENTRKIADLEQDLIMNGRVF